MNKIITLLFITLGTFISACSGGGTAGTGGVSELKGFIVNENDQPLSNVTVQLSNLQQSAVSDQSGAFSLTIDQKGGKYSFRFDGAGLLGVVLDVDIPESKDRVVVVFRGNTKENKVVELGLRVEDDDSDSDDSEDDSRDDNDDRDDHNSGGGNGSDDNGGDDSNDDSDDDSDDDDNNSNSGSDSGSSNSG